MYVRHTLCQTDMETETEKQKKRHVGHNNADLHILPIDFERETNPYFQALVCLCVPACPVQLSWRLTRSLRWHVPRTFLILRQGDVLQQ